MPLFFYTQLPCCTLRSCSHLYVSGGFYLLPFTAVELGVVEIWFWPFASFQLWSVVHQNHSCAIPPSSPTVAVVTVGPPAVPSLFFPPCFWVDSCPLAAVLFMQERPRSSPTSTPRWLRQERATGRDPTALARHGSSGHKESVSFWLHGPSTRWVLCWLCHNCIYEWLFPLCTIDIRTFVQCNHLPLSTLWGHPIFVVIYSCHKTHP